MATPVDTAERDLRNELRVTDLQALANDEAMHAGLSHAVHRYCEAGRSSGAAPEQVIRDLKGIIYDHFDSMVVRPGVLAKDVVWHAVRRCIRAYYAADAAP